MHREIPDFIEVYPNAITEDLVHKLISYIDTVQADISSRPEVEFDLGERRFGNNLDRKDFQTFLNGNHEKDLYDEILTQLMPFFDKYAYKHNVNTPGLEYSHVKIQKTEKYGGFSVWHSEQGDLDAGTRSLVWSVYLNDVPEAGETEFLYQQKRLKPKARLLAVWPASFTHIHRGNPPIGGTKYIITGWGAYAPEKNNS